MFVYIFLSNGTVVPFKFQVPPQNSAFKNHPRNILDDENHLYGIVLVHTISRHTVVCHAAQEAGAPHREYIYRKKVNTIFTPL